MSFSATTATPDKLESILQDGEVCVFICSAGKAVSPFVQGLIAKANQLMKSEFAYLKIHIGFFNDKKPYVIAEWTARGNNSLERRWLLNKVRDRVKHSFNPKKLAIYLDESASLVEVVDAEDFWFASQDAFTGQPSYTSFRIITDPVFDIKKADPHREVRIAHLDGFRKWINENPDELTSLEIGARLQSFAQAHKCGFEAYDVERLKSLGLNLLLAVGQASDLSPSRLFIVTHNLKPSGPKPLLLVGKGVTFDTGGINVKAYENFVNCMKNDMGGAALMSHVFMALVESGYAGPLVLAIPACENLVAKRSMKPGVVIKSYAGKKVVVDHTDAEGRLILADAIAYAGDVFKPRLTISAATLTTASLRQFSNYFTAAHFASAEMKKTLASSAESWGEAYSCWDEFLPFLDGNKSVQADLTNMGRLPSHANIGGGSNVAAHFLKEFARSDFLHLDIFASTWNWSGEYPGSKYGATGAPFNSFLDAVRQF